ncbi:MAG: hypothetical protein IJD75_01365, partial [Clostridia bacterium]|nr:hypothetical protein [Clostridia bacterium]
FTRNCTIRVGTRALTLSSLSDGFFIMSTDNVIRIDGDWIEVVSDDFYNKKSDYYHIENGVIYHYYYKTANGEWIKMIYNSDPEDEKIGSELLDKRNYTRSKENFFVWILNGDIDKQVKGLSDIRVKRVNGSLAIVGTFFVDAIECEESIRFTKFGITKIDAPWEELEKATLYIPPQSK